jgi:hypothetical protein
MSGNGKIDRVWDNGHQKWIEVETLETRKVVRKDKQKPFAKIDLADAAKAFKALGNPKAMVRVWLLHRVWKRKSRTVTAPNGELERLGVSRNIKLRALRQLEAGGLISIDHRHGKSPLVTVR